MARLGSKECQEGDDPNPSVAHAGHTILVQDRQILERAAPLEPPPSLSGGATHRLDLFRCGLTDHAASAGLIGGSMIRSRAGNVQSGSGGDLIINIDGQPINSFADLNSYLVFHTRPGQTIEITVLRNGERQVLSLTLGVRPE